MARFETKPETADDEAPEWVGPSAELLPKPARRKRKNASSPHPSPAATPSPRGEGSTGAKAAVVSGHYGKNDEERGKDEK